MKLFGSEVENLHELPLMDVYLDLQINNLALVDVHLRQLEGQMVREYFKTDHLPLPLSMFVSALSQLWIFGLYELLRTWKQRISEVIDYGKALRELHARKEKESEVRSFIDRKSRELQKRLPDGDRSLMDAVRQVEADDSYLTHLGAARDRMMEIFRRVEALRVTLAKQEVPKTKGVKTFAPGYARIDRFSDTLCWPVTDNRGSMAFVSRQSLVEGLRNASSK